MESSKKDIKVLINSPSQETLSTANETDGFSTSISKQKELNENFKSMFGTLYGFSDSPSKSTSRRSSKRSSLFLTSGETPNYMKPTECLKSKSREPVHKREIILEVPQSPVKVQKRKPKNSVSKTVVQRIDTKTMDDYRKIVQSNIKSCKNLLAKDEI